MYTPASTAATNDIVEYGEYGECIRSNNRPMGSTPKFPIRRRLENVGNQTAVR